MKKYQYILLDWDGNLAQTLHVWLEACRAVTTSRGLKLTDEEVAASFGAFIEHMKNWGITDPEKAMEEADVIAKRKLPEVELYPDALFVLEKLHNAGKTLALITSSPHENVQHLLEKHQLTHFFKVIVAGDDVERHKPHPESLEKALSLLDGHKEQAVMVGDSDKDIGAANNFGIDSILFYPPEHRTFYDLAKLQELNPTHTVADFKEILGIV